MCDVKDECTLESVFWVQSQRPRQASRNIGACSRHIAQAIKSIGAYNLEQRQFHDKKDGVIVKLRTTVKDQNWSVWT